MGWSVDKQVVIYCVALQTKEIYLKTNFQKKNCNIPLNANNYLLLEQYSKDFCQYIETLLIDDKNILHSGRKTGFLGLVICLKNMFLLYKKNNETWYGISINIQVEPGLFGNVFFGN